MFERVQLHHPHASIAGSGLMHATGAKRPRQALCGLRNVQQIKKTVAGVESRGGGMRLNEGA